MNLQDRIYIDWDENYGKTFKLVHTPEGRQSGEWSPNLVSVVTPENGDAWTDWIELENTDSWKENWNNVQKSLGGHKYNQIIRSMRRLDNLKKKYKMSNTIKLTEKQFKDLVKNILLNENEELNNTTYYSEYINPKFYNILQNKRISPSDSIQIMKAGQPDCSRFVNEFSEKIGPVGNAWIAHDNDNAGITVWSSFNNLNENQINRIVELWNKINKKGGGKDGGPFNRTTSYLVNSIVPKTVPVELQLDDIVGIYYPASTHHEQAFYEASMANNDRFVQNESGVWVPTQKTLNGEGWGMNTHLGIVGAIKNGRPIIFHNISGSVYADPANKLVGGGRIAWVKRPKGGVSAWIKNIEIKNTIKQLAKKTAKKIQNYIK